MTDITSKEIIEILNDMVATYKYKPQTADDVVKTGAFISATYSNKDIAKAILDKIKEKEKPLVNPFRETSSAIIISPTTKEILDKHFKKGNL